jgi:hypothetical protein
MDDPPRFLIDLPLVDLWGWWLRVECCDRTACLPFRMVAEQRPGANLGNVLRVLRCRVCGQRVARVALVANPAAGAAGRPAPGGWRIEITFPDLPGGWT